VENTGSAPDLPDQNASVIAAGSVALVSEPESGPAVAPGSASAVDDSDQPKVAGETPLSFGEALEAEFTELGLAGHGGGEEVLEAEDMLLAAGYETGANAPSADLLAAMADLGSTGPSEQSPDENSSKRALLQTAKRLKDTLFGSLHNLVQGSERGAEAESIQVQEPDVDPASVSSSAASTSADAEETEDERPTIVAVASVLDAALEAADGIDATEESRLPRLEEPLVEEATAEGLLAEEATAEETIVGQTIAEEPLVEEPLVEEPIAEEPTAEEPTAEQPIAEELLHDKVAAAPLPSLAAFVPLGAGPFCIEIVGPAPPRRKGSTPVFLQLAGISAVGTSVRRGVARDGLEDDLEAGRLQETAGAPEDAEESHLGPFELERSPEDTVAGDISVERLLVVDEDSPAATTVDLAESQQPGADVVAEGGAIRVALSLGTEAPAGRDKARKGVAVPPAEPVGSGSSRGSDVRDASATDLIALARLKRDLGGPGVRVDAMETEDSLPQLAASGEDEDWLGADQDMGPFGGDDGADP